MRRHHPGPRAWKRPWLAETKKERRGTRCASQWCPEATSRYLRV